MGISLEEYLKIVAPHLSSDLISPGARDRIQLLSSILPPFSLAGLEFRLGAGKSRVDFQVGLPPRYPKPTPGVATGPSVAILAGLLSRVG
jgi:hypothetical protein